MSAKRSWSEAHEIDSYDAKQLQHEVNFAFNHLNKSHLNSILKSAANRHKEGKTMPHTLWYQEFKPFTTEGGFQAQNVVKELFEWLWRYKNRGLKKPKDDDEYLPDAKDAEKESNVIILQGPPGCEKTTTVYAMAELFQFHVMEVHPGNTTNRSLQNLSGASLSRSMGKRQTHSMFQKKGKRRKLNSEKPKVEQETHSTSLILLDEIDGMLQQNGLTKSGLKALFAKTKVPVILTCNQIPKDLRNLRLPVLCFRRPMGKDCYARITDMLLKKGKIFSINELIQLVEIFQCDLRRLSMHLQFWCSGETIACNSNDEFFLQLIHLAACPISSFQNLASIFTLHSSDSTQDSFHEFFQHYFSVTDHYFLASNICSWFGQIKGPDLLLGHKPTKKVPTMKEFEQDCETRRTRAVLNRQLCSFMDSLDLVDLIETQNAGKFKVPRELSMICDLACTNFQQATKSYQNKNSEMEFSLIYPQFASAEECSQELKEVFGANHLPMSSAWRDIQSTIDIVCLQQEPLLQKERKPRKRRRLNSDRTHVLDQGATDFPDSLHAEVMNRCKVYL